MSGGPLLDFVDKTTLSWVQKLPLVALPPLRMHAGGHQKLVHRDRDIFILTMLLLSAVAISLFHVAETRGMTYVEREIAAAALYRCIDGFIPHVRTGIFLNFRGDIPLPEQPA